MRSRRRGARPCRTAVAAAALLVTGCAGEPGAAPPAPPPTTAVEASDAAPTAVPTPPPPAPSAPVAPDPPPPTGAPSELVPSADPPAAEVLAQGTSFSPAEVAVPAGATVTWRNALPIRHTVTAGTREAPLPDRFDLQLVDPGQLVTAMVTQTTPYFCRIHAGMQGAITVPG